MTRAFDFTTSPEEFQAHVNWMSPKGGGDGPEAVASALAECVKMPWRPEATKIVVHIADAPPHGLGERGDGFPEGCPEGNDPLLTATEMLQRSITCYTVGCEPALGEYRFARDFMVAMAEKTGGQAVTLDSAALLADVLLGGAMEELGLERLMRDITAEAAAAQAAGDDEEAILERVTAKLQKSGTRCKQMKHNAQIYSPFSAQLQAATGGLNEWRAAIPASAVREPKRDELMHSARHSAAPRSSRFSKKRHIAHFEEGELDAGVFASHGATTCTTEEGVISKEQVKRCMSKGKGRGMY